MKFEAGKTYATRSPCDHNCVITVTVGPRTEKMITAVVDGVRKNFRIFEVDGIESFRPWGNYSMAPTIRATGIVQ